MMRLAISPSISETQAPPIAEAAGWVRNGTGNRRLLNLSQAVPSYPPPDDLPDELARLARLPESHLYTDIRGLPELRQALARHMSEDYRAALQDEHVTITAGCNQAFCASMMALAERGDNAILPAPYYFNHQMWLQMLGIEIRHVPAFGGRDGLPAPEEAEALIDSRTRAIVLCSPNNPTGATYPPALLQSFMELAAKHGLALVIDETYKDFRSDPAPPHGLFPQPGWEDQLVQLYSFSKAFAITGYRVGSIIAGPRLQAEIEKVMDCIAICAPALSQLVALHGLTNWSAWKEQKAALMADRRKALHAAFRQPELRFGLASSGAYFAYVRHPFAGEASKSVAQRLARQHGLLCLPGSMFGPGQDDYLRLAFANVPAEDMAEMAARLIESQG